jgi:ring-1,2-phenylacetyl-CoA epoxidase subunit PaaE
MNDSDTLTLQVTERIRETPDTVSFVVQPTGQASPSYRAGQFLTLLFEDELGTKPVRRSYSFATTPGVDPQWMFTVKKKPNGLVSRYLHEHIDVGDLL